MTTYTARVDLPGYFGHRTVNSLGEAYEYFRGAAKLVLGENTTVIIHGCNAIAYGGGWNDGGTAIGRLAQNEPWLSVTGEWRYEHV
jgi:hypothetical protein